MKKIIYSIAILSLLMASCVDNSEDFNQDHGKAYHVPADALLLSAEKSLTDQLTDPSVNVMGFGRYFSQYWSPVTYTQVSRYRIYQRKVSGTFWNTLYADVIGPLESVKQIVNKEVKPIDLTADQFKSVTKNKLAVADIIEIYTYQIIVDAFGNVPYSEAENSKENVLPKYDDAKSIYIALIDRLNTAIADLDTSNSSFKTGDNLYDGDVSKWKLFANSLKVKMGVNLIETDPTLAKKTIESAYASGVILDNSNNAVFKYQVGSPNYNPIYNALIASNRHDHIPAATIVDAMNTLKDPRRDVYFTPLSDGTFSGGKYGYPSSYPDFSHVGDKLKKPDFTSLLMEATEINFYLAEAAATSSINVGNTTEHYYNNAIKASFENWGIANKADNYLSNSKVTFTTAVGANDKEKIAYQEWIAFYNRGFAGWTTYRRLNYPVLVAPATAYPEADGEVPKRLTYPIKEQTVNGSNLKAAIAAMGGDKLNQHIFWDKK